MVLPLEYHYYWILLPFVAVIMGLLCICLKNFSKPQQTARSRRVARTTRTTNTDSQISIISLPIESNSEPLTPPPSYEAVMSAPSLYPPHGIPSYDDAVKNSEGF